MKTSTSQEIKQTLWEILDQLPPSQRHQVLDFARFLRQQGLASPPAQGETDKLAPAPEQVVQLRLVPSNSLVGLTGLVSLGGDAVTAAEDQGAKN
jgi:hypothetical protein